MGKRSTCDGKKTHHKKKNLEDSTGTFGYFQSSALAMSSSRSHRDLRSVSAMLVCGDGDRGRLSLRSLSTIDDDAISCILFGN